MFIIDKKIKKERKRFTAFDKACICKCCNVCVNSLYRYSYQSLKFGERKKRLYKPDQSPFTPLGAVNCGPQCSNVAKKQSCLKRNKN